MPAVQNCCCSKGSAPYWSNPPFLIFEIRVLWCSALSARAPECQKLKMMGLTSMTKCKALTGSTVKGLICANLQKRSLKLVPLTK